MNQLIMRLAGALAMSALPVSAAFAASSHLGAGLREMVMRYEAGDRPPAAAARSASSKLPMRSAGDGARRDRHGHVAVSIHLDGRIPLADAADRLRDYGDDARLP